MAVPIPGLDGFVDELQVAINEGDKLPNKPESLGAHVQRRALILALQYQRKGHGDSVSAMWNTPLDAARIYNMLRKLGYEAENIRILSELEDDQVPTRDNVTASLVWLTSNAKEGDFRFLHFSGHGALVESKKGEGKEAQRFRLPTSSHAEVQSWNSQPLTSQEIPREESTFYREAIITAWATGDWRRKTSTNMIFDRDLNDILATLPPGCKLTTTFDCCHSGRMINNRLKLLGGLCRSVLNKITVDQSGLKAVRTSNVLVIETEDHSTPMPTSPHSNHGPLVLDAPTPPHSGDEPSVPDVGEPTSVISDTIVMSEKLPENEKRMDRIKAQTFSWGACHRSQFAYDDEDWKGGHFTYAFTAVMEKVTKDTTIRELHRLIDDMIKDISIQSNAVVTQFCQLWASCDYGSDEDEATRCDELLDLPVLGNI